MGFIDNEDIIRRERLVGIALLVGIAIFTVLDVVEDLHEGSTMTHTLSEMAVILTCVCTAIYLWRSVSSAWCARTTAMGVALSQARSDAQRWRETNASLAKGLTEAIEKQMDDWGLSGAQKEIAFLLIKGLSFKEIADSRSTSEHTVRQQAAVIYRKSGLEGRAQLSAFFLEDLFAEIR